MIDYFALLEIERRPAITEESLKTAYFRKSESLLLDKADPDDLSSLNMAFRVIGNPAARIQHLLVLEFGMRGEGNSALRSANYLGPSSKPCNRSIRSLDLSQQKVQPFFVLWRSREWTERVNDWVGWKMNFHRKNAGCSLRLINSTGSGRSVQPSAANRLHKSRLASRSSKSG